MKIFWFRTSVGNYYTGQNAGKIILKLIDPMDMAPVSYGWSYSAMRGGPGLIFLSSHQVCCVKAALFCGKEEQ